MVWKRIRLHPRIKVSEEKHRFEEDIEPKLLLITAFVVNPQIWCDLEWAGTIRFDQFLDSGVFRLFPALFRLFPALFRRIFFPFFPFFLFFFRFFSDFSFFFWFFCCFLNYCNFLMPSAISTKKAKTKLILNSNLFSPPLLARKFGHTSEKTCSHSLGMVTYFERLA